MPAPAVNSDRSTSRTHAADAPNHLAPERSFWAPTMIIAAVLFVALAGYMRWQAGVAPAQVLADAGASADRPPPVAQVQRAVEAMQLITVRLDTQVSVSAKDVSWRGDVLASVQVPVSLLFGVDLARARVDALDLGITRGVRVRVPTPTRLATEVYQMNEKADVQTGWLRWRAMGGEYVLGLARKAVSDEARRMVLTPEDQQRVLDQSRARIEQLVKVMVGDGLPVSVEFEDHANDTESR